MSRNYHTGLCSHTHSCPSLMACMECSRQRVCSASQCVCEQCTTYSTDISCILCAAIHKYTSYTMQQRCMCTPSTVLLSDTLLGQRLIHAQYTQQCISSSNRQRRGTDTVSTQQTIDAARNDSCGVGSDVHISNDEQSTYTPHTAAIHSAHSHNEQWYTDMHTLHTTIHYCVCSIAVASQTQHITNQTTYTACQIHRRHTSLPSTHQTNQAASTTQLNGAGYIMQQHQYVHLIGSCRLMHSHITQPQLLGSTVNITVSCYSTSCGRVHNTRQHEHTAQCTHLAQLRLLPQHAPHYSCLHKNRQHTVHTPQQRATQTHNQKC